jgi:integrase
MIHLDFIRFIRSGGSGPLAKEALTPEVIRSGEISPKMFDPKDVSPFVNKSVSEATRRAYGRALWEFFQFVGMKHPEEVVAQDIILWRDWLRSRKKSAATVAFKLSVVRSFFEYLKVAGAVPLNPASTKLVSPPELPSEPAGRALSAKEVRYLLSGPDRGKPGGGEGLRADAGHAATQPARLGGLFLAGLIRQVEPRAVDAAVQGQGRQRGGLAPAEGREGGDRPLPPSRQEAARGRSF